MKELVEVIAKALVDNPEEVVVTESMKGEDTLIELKVSPADMGKVIGKQGRIAKAIRAVVKAATSEGIRIPDDLALIGFDNTYISQMSHPSVAAVSLPRFQLGYMACEVLSERIMNPASDEPRHFLLETELVLRDSV